MKKPILTLSFSFICFFAIAQKFAVINDKDGYVNVRKSGNSNSLIVGRLTANSIFGLDEEDAKKSEWIKIYIQNTRQNGLEGYIYHDKFKFISSFKSLHTVRRGDNWYSAKNDSISVELQSMRFFVKQHKLTYNKPNKYNNEGRFIQKIDKRIFWGTDGEIPKHAISLLKVAFKGQVVIIPVSAYNDLYEPRFSTLNVFLAPDKSIYIELDNGDGAGAYTVIWVIRDGIYQHRYVDNSNV